MTTVIFFSYLAGIASFVGFSAAVFGKRNTIREEV
jgi:hypothetical protein